MNFVMRTELPPISIRPGSMVHCALTLREIRLVQHTMLAGNRLGLS